MSQNYSIFNDEIYSKKKFAISSSHIPIQLTKDSDRKLQIKSIFSFLYEQKFQDILLIADKEFTSYLEENFDKVIKNNFTSNCIIQNEINKAKIEKIKAKQYEIFRQEKQLLKTELENFYKTPDNYKYLTDFQKHCSNTDLIAIHPCSYQSYGKFIQIKNENSPNEYYLICVNCKKCYKNDFIYMYCKPCKKNYYSCIGNFTNQNNNEENLPYATWKNYHCGSIINGIMKCIKCKKNLLYNEKKEILICSNKRCNFKGKPKNIIWKCAICGSDFNSEVKAYNPLEMKVYTNAIEYALLLKELAKPTHIIYCNSCGKSLKNVIFYHKTDCKGELYMGKLQNDEVIICSKCHRINNYTKFIWTCPFCERNLKRPLYSFNKKINFSNMELLSNRNINNNNNSLNKSIKINSNKFKSIYLNGQNDNSKEKQSSYEKRNAANQSKNCFWKFMAEIYPKFMDECSNEDFKSKDKEKQTLNLKNDIEKNRLINNYADKIKSSSKGKKNRKQTLFEILSSRKKSEDSSHSNSTKYNNINTRSTKFPISAKNLTIFNSDNDNNHEFDGLKSKEIIGRNSKNYNIKKYRLFKSRYGEFNLTSENIKNQTKNKNSLLTDLANSKKNNKPISNKKKSDVYMNNIKKNTNNTNNTSEFNKDISYSNRVNMDKNGVKEINNVVKNIKRISVKRRFIRSKKNHKQSFNLPMNNSNNILIIDSEEKKREKNKEIKIIINNSAKNVMKYSNFYNNEEKLTRNKSTFLSSNKINEKPIRFRSIHYSQKVNFFKDNENKNDKIKINNQNNESIDNVINKNKKTNTYRKFSKNQNNINNDQEKSNASYENNIFNKTSTSNNKNSIESDLTSTQILSDKQFKSEKNVQKSNVQFRPSYFLNTKYMLNSSKNNKKNITKNSIKFCNTNLDTSIGEKGNIKKYNITPSRNYQKIKKSDEKNIENVNNLPKTDRKSGNGISKFAQILNYKNEEEKEKEEEKKKNDEEINDEEKIEKEFKKFDIDENNEISTNNINNNKNEPKKALLDFFNEPVKKHKIEFKRIDSNIICNPDKIEKLSQICIIPKFDDLDYEYLDAIGEGAFGTVYSVKEKSTNVVYALKKIICKDYQDLLINKNIAELSYSLEHKNIMKLYKIQFKYLDFTTYSLSVLMEKAIQDWSSEIMERRKSKNYYTQKELINILKQLLDALMFLEHKTIAHRDIKPQNILIYPNNVYKIADLGEAKNLGDKNTKEVTLKGCELFMAPVLYKGLIKSQKDVCHNAYKSDIFSLGYCFLNAMCLEKFILEQIRNLDKKKDIIVIINKLIDNNIYSKAFVDLIYNMIEANETTRYDYSKISEELKNF